MNNIQIGNTVKILREQIDKCQKPLEIIHQKMVEFNKTLDEYETEIEARKLIQDSLASSNVQVDYEFSSRLENEIKEFVNLKEDLQCKISALTLEETSLNNRYKPVIEVIRKEIEKIERTNQFLVW